MLAEEEEVEWHHYTYNQQLESHSMEVYYPVVYQQPLTDNQRQLLVKNMIFFMELQIKIFNL